MVSKRTGSRRAIERRKLMAEATGGYIWRGPFSTKGEVKQSTIPGKLNRDIFAFKAVKDPRRKRGWLALFKKVK